MQTILLIGDFKGLRPVLRGLSGVHLVHCHSIDSLRSEWAKARVFAVLASVRELSPSIFELLREAQGKAPDLRWSVFVQQTSHELMPFSGPKQLFFQGDPQKDWAPRLKRFLEDGRLDHRRRERQSCRGGVRVKDSEFAKTPTGLRAYGTIHNLSQNGAALAFEDDFLFPEGEFLEVTFRDLKGVARAFHGQVRWRKRRSDGVVEVGLQFIAAA